MHRAQWGSETAAVRTAAFMTAAVLLTVAHGKRNRTHIVTDLPMSNLFFFLFFFSAIVFGLKISHYPRPG